jgi:hypothetical protein
MSSITEGAVQRHTTPYRHDMVGSFLRPDSLKEARAQFSY